jgi:beta-mannosidase
MSRLELDLSGNDWKMERMRPGQGTAEKFHELPSEFQGTMFSWNSASVPGDVYSDLQRAGEIEDPYYGRNMHKAKWVQDYEWWYVRRFDVPQEMSGKELRIMFEGVDYSCQVWLNGYELGRHEGMFSPFSFDITDKVRFERWNGGSNILMVKLDPPPKNYRNVGGKKVCFSGDYYTGIIPIGIWRPVKLLATEKTRIDAFRVESELNGSNAVVHTEVDMHNSSDDTLLVKVQISLKGHNFESQAYTQEVTLEASPGTCKARLSVAIPDANLWWPWDMGEQHLYDIELVIVREDQVLDRLTDVIGVREIKMAMNPGFTEEEVQYPWTFMINGKRHFLRSACWGGQPSFLYGRNRNEKYERLLHMVKECNINNLRIFGWHPPEIPYFYKLCDQLGITVWTNFTFATQAFPGDPEYVESVVYESVEIVKERRNHPSNIFWMGGEEVFFSPAHTHSGNKLIMEAIGEAVAGHTSVPYGLASPLSHGSGLTLGFKPKDSLHANGHYYAAGRSFMEDFYPSLDCAIIPELTAASAPSPESLAKFIPPDELWPMGPSWGYHWADIDKLKALNVEVFGDERVESLEQFAEATQVAQGTIFQYALELYRRRKPRLSGVSLCHFITNWPDIKWGLVDYYGIKKKSFDFVKRSYQPLLPSLEFSKRRWLPGERFAAKLWTINDSYVDYEAISYSWIIKDNAGQSVCQGELETKIAADSSTAVGEVQWQVEGIVNEMFTVELELRRQNGELLSFNVYTLLLGDQEEVRQTLKKHLEESNERIRRYGKSYYRYNPELWELE